MESELLLIKFHVHVWHANGWQVAIVELSGVHLDIGVEAVTVCLVHGLRLRLETLVYETYLAPNSLSANGIEVSVQLLHLFAGSVV